MNGDTENGAQRRAKLNAGRAWLEIVALSHERLVLQIYGPSPDDNGPIAAFPFEFENLEKVLGHEGAIQVNTDDGNLTARATGDNLWLVYEVKTPPIQDSCLIPKSEFRRALRRLQGPTML